MNKNTKTDQEANNPFIGSLVRKMDQITDVLVTQKYDIALRGMFQVFYSLKPGDQESAEGKAFYEYIMKTRKTRDSVRDTDPLVLEAKQDAFDYYHQEGFERCFQWLSKIIWNGGYYDNDAYKFHDPSGGRRSGI